MSWVLVLILNLTDMETSVSVINSYSTLVECKANQAQYKDVENKIQYLCKKS